MLVALVRTCVLLPEEFISDHRHIMMRGYQPDTSTKNHHRLSGRLGLHGRIHTYEAQQQNLQFFQQWFIPAIVSQLSMSVCFGVLQVCHVFQWICVLVCCKRVMCFNECVFCYLQVFPVFQWLFWCVASVSCVSLSVCFAIRKCFLSFSECFDICKCFLSFSECLF